MSQQNNSAEYYKVVNRVNDKYFSAFISNPALQLEYSTYKFTEAKPELIELGYGICIFEDLSAAEEYRFNYGNAIFTCEAVDVWTPTSKVGQIYGARFAGAWLEKLISSMREGDFVSRFASEARMTKSIRLIEQID